MSDKDDLRPGDTITFTRGGCVTEGEILNVLSPGKLAGKQHGKLYAVCYGDGILRYIKPEDVIEVVPPPKK
jgi:hypothetical protein